MLSTCRATSSDLLVFFSAKFISQNLMMSTSSVLLFIFTRMQKGFFRLPFIILSLLLLRTYYVIIYETIIETSKAVAQYPNELKIIPRLLLILNITEKFSNRVWFIFISLHRMIIVRVSDMRIIRGILQLCLRFILASRASVIRMLDKWHEINCI